MHGHLNVKCVLCLFRAAFAVNTSKYISILTSLTSKFRTCLAHSGPFTPWLHHTHTNTCIRVNCFATSKHIKGAVFLWSHLSLKPHDRPISIQWRTYIEVCSRNHCFHGKAISIKYSEYVIFVVALCMLIALSSLFVQLTVWRLTTHIWVVPYRTAPPNVAFYTFIQKNIVTEYFKHALYSPFFFSSKCSLFHNANLFSCCIIHILYTECAKIKKNISGAKGLRHTNNYKIVNQLKSFKTIIVAPTCFGLHKPSSGSCNLCVAKVTMLISVTYIVIWSYRYCGCTIHTHNGTEQSMQPQYR